MTYVMMLRPRKTYGDTLASYVELPDHESLEQYGTYTCVGEGVGI